MNKKRILFICQHNSARSQIAEEYLREIGGEAYDVQSAGLEPTEVNPLVVEAMRDDGIDLSGKGTQSVFDLYKSGQLFDYIITVCSPEVEAKCPVFPGVAKRLNWPFPDPAKAKGTHADKMSSTRKIRDNIKARMQEFIDKGE